MELKEEGDRAQNGFTKQRTVVIPPNTTPHAYEGEGSILLEKGENRVPVGQSLANLSLVFDGFKKLINRLSHGNRGKFTSAVRCSSETAKLKIVSGAVRGQKRLRVSHFQA